MTAASCTPRLLDHLVLPVADLAVARRRLGALGFTVAADALHPFGTHNACVFFADNTYLEPLAVASPQDCAAAATGGNAFVARDQAYRFRRGQDGFSAVVVRSGDAIADHERFRALGLSGGDILTFSRTMALADGTPAVARFRLAFAADLRAPDFFFFSCERIQPLPADRAALESHANGVLGIAEVVLSEPHPGDFRSILQAAVERDQISAHAFGMEIAAENARISVLDPVGMTERFGRRTSHHARGLRGRAVVLTVADLAATEQHLVANAIDFIRKDNRLIVPEAPGQGVMLAFGE